MGIRIRNTIIARCQRKRAEQHFADSAEPIDLGDG
jgi:hypothetical protein